MKKLSVIILTILCLTLSLVPSVYADEVQDVSFTYTEADTSVHYLCGGTTGVSCSGYQYIFLNFVGSDTDNTQRTLRYTMGTDVGYMTGIGVTPSSVYTLPSSFNELNIVWYGSGNFFTSFPNATVTVTLSASKGCPACPSCPACEDCTRPPFVKMVIDSFWQYHVAIASTLPAILGIFFVYRLIKGRIR